MGREKLFRVHLLYAQLIVEKRPSRHGVDASHKWEWNRFAYLIWRYNNYLYYIN